MLRQAHHQHLLQVLQFNLLVQLQQEQLRSLPKRVWSIQLTVQTSKRALLSQVLQQEHILQL
jgi:hypothetical protein